MVRFRLVLLQDLKQSCACSVADVRIAGSETSRDLAPLVSTESARRYWPEVRCAKRGVLKQRSTVTSVLPNHGFIR
jgi:hypothetical protein